jgi:hypothetical protein
MCVCVCVCVCVRVERECVVAPSVGESFSSATGNASSATDYKADTRPWVCTASTPAPKRALLATENSDQFATSPVTADVSKRTKDRPGEAVDSDINPFSVEMESMVTTVRLVFLERTNAGFKLQSCLWCYRALSFNHFDTASASQVSNRWIQNHTSSAKSCREPRTVP